MTWSQYKNPFPFPVPFFARLEFAGILETLDQCSHGGPFSIQTRTTTEAIRVETSTSNYGLDCVWFTYICFSMEKDIVFVCTLFAMDIFFTIWPKIWKWEFMSQNDDVLIWYWLKARRPAHSSYKLGTDMCRTCDSVVPSFITHGRSHLFSR